jgi:polar amino acid transport system ATP-binding protein
MSGGPVLETVGLTKSYGDIVVVDDVSIRVNEGEVMCLLGPSGAGKTTLLRCMCHLETFESGAVFVGNELFGFRVRNEKLTPLKTGVMSIQRRRIGMVFQSFNLFGHMTLMENIVAAPVHVLGRNRKEVEVEAAELLSLVGLSDKASAYAGNLSGGQQQRGAIARALAMKPQVVLFDEPTSALDPESTGDVLAVMEKLAAERVTMVVVTHEVQFARRAASRVVFMENGRVAAEGTPDDMIVNPKSERVRTFLRQEGY